MSDRDDFLNEFLPRLIEAERALHKGDIKPRLELWTRSDPVTLFGAFGVCNSGWDQVGPTFDWLGSMFSNNERWDFELVAADVVGDLAYTVGYERHVTSVQGGPVQPHVLRVTQVYRRENGEWKVVHRHGDTLIEQRLPEEISDAVGTS